MGMESEGQGNHLVICKAMKDSVGEAISLPHASGLELDSPNATPVLLRAGGIFASKFILPYKQTDKYSRSILFHSA